MRILASLLVLLLSASCATSRQGPVVGAEGDDGISIEVQNGSAVTLRVFVLVGNNEWLLGRVDALGTTTMSLPQGMAGMVALSVRPSGSGQSGEQHISERFNISSGQRVSWRLRTSAGTVLPRVSNLYIFTCETDARC